MTIQHAGPSAVPPTVELWLVRHGETEWSKRLRHTGRTDVPLTDPGRRRARGLKSYLDPRSFDKVLASPLVRARETAELAGFTTAAIELDNDLMEWDYGTFEGQTTADLAHRLGSFSIWTTPVPEGESLGDVGARADRVLRQLANTGSRCLLFSHAHFLRILTARWLGLAPAHGRLFALDAGALSVLGHEHGYPVIRAWNLAGTPPWASDPGQDAGATSPH
jgi:broad specificity phosphatase PhoE